MKKRSNAQVFVILAAVVFIILALALGSGGDSQIPSLPPSQPSPSPLTTLGTTSSSIEEIFPPGVEGSLNATQQAAFERLKTESRIQPSLRVERGVVRFITMAVLSESGAATNLQEKAYGFLQRNSDLLNLDNPAQNLKVESTSSDGLGNEQVIFSQFINDNPVYGAQIRVHFNETGEVSLFEGAYIPSIVPSSTPAISEELAQTIASQSIGITDAIFPSVPMLFYYDASVFGEGPSQPQLVWKVLLTSDSFDGEFTVFIDAISGEMLRQSSDLRNLSREVFDNHGKPYHNTSISTLIMNENGCLPNQACETDAKNAYDFSGQYGNFLMKNFNRNSYDGKGGSIKSYVNVADFSICFSPAKPNAAWVNSAMYYSKGMSAANDVVAHEMTHGLIDSFGGLEYYNQSGALNESFADVFAVLMDDGENGQNWNNPNWRVTDWEIGEDLQGEPFRDLSNPLRYNQPDHWRDFKPAKIAWCRNDNGYVHTNSGIPNKAAYLLIQNGSITVEGIIVHGIGPNKVSKIYYQALAHHLNSSWSFRDARDSIIVACSQLNRKRIVELEDCRQVLNAFAAVGIGNPAVLPPQVTPSLTPLPISLANSSTILVFDSSGSMNEPDQSGITKLQAARAAGINILDIIQAENEAQGPAESQVGLVDFNFDAQVGAPISNDVAAARTGLNGLYANGGTGMPDGLKVALDMFEQNPVDSKPILILLSDGLPNIGHNNNQFISPEEVKQQVMDQAKRAGEMGVCVYTVGFGVPGGIGTVSGDASIDEKLLEEIHKTAGCGDYYNAQTATQLANIYIELRHASTGNILLRQSGQIAQGQQVEIGNVQIPANQSMFLFTLNWPGSRLEPLLYDPGERIVDENYSGASISSTGTLASVIVNNPRNGQWRVAALGADVPQGITTYNALLSGRQNTTLPPTAPALPVAIVLLLLGSGGIGVYVLARKVPNRKKYPDPTVRGSTGARLIGEAGSLAGSTLPLPWSITIGRGSACDLRLNQPDVSRQHARIRYAQGSWYIQDLGSQIGTFVNGQQIQATRLNHGDRIRIGSNEFIFSEVKPAGAKS